MRAQSIFKLTTTVGLFSRPHSAAALIGVYKWAGEGEGEAEGQTEMREEAIMRPEGNN